MSLFSGTFQYTLDNKGRVSVPNQFRDVLKAKEDDRLIVTRSLDGDCLQVFAWDRWQGLMEQVNRLPEGRQKTAFIRNYLAPGQPLQMDKMGRVLIPANLRTSVNLERDVMIVGALSKFEIWDLGRWDAYQEGSLDEAKDLMNSGILQI